jgi:ribosomal protein S19
MSRSKWKGNFIEKSLLNKEKNKLWSRSSTVPESMIGNFVLIQKTQ